MFYHLSLSGEIVTRKALPSHCHSISRAHAWQSVCAIVIECTFNTDNTDINDNINEYDNNDSYHYNLNFHHRNQYHQWRRYYRNHCNLGIFFYVFILFAKKNKLILCFKFLCNYPLFFNKYFLFYYYFAV